MRHWGPPPPPPKQLFIWAPVGPQLGQNGAHLGMMLGPLPSHRAHQRPLSFLKMNMQHGEPPVKGSFITTFYIKQQFTLPPWSDPSTCARKEQEGCQPCSCQTRAIFRFEIAGSRHDIKPVARTIIATYKQVQKGRGHWCVEIGYDTARSDVSTGRAGGCGTNWGPQGDLLCGLSI